jgi:hypothetical protein
MAGQSPLLRELCAHVPNASVHEGGYVFLVPPGCARTPGASSSSSQQRQLSLSSLWRTATTLGTNDDGTSNDVGRLSFVLNGSGELTTPGSEPSEPDPVIPLQGEGANWAAILAPLPGVAPVYGVETAPLVPTSPSTAAVPSTTRPTNASNNGSSAASNGGGGDAGTIGGVVGGLVGALLIAVVVFVVWNSRARRASTDDDYHDAASIATADPLPHSTQFPIQANAEDNVQA